MHPDVLTPAELRVALIFALLNPVVLVVAVWLGRRANQWQKIPVAAFGGAIAGTLVVWLAARLRLGDFSRLGRAGAGLFVAQFAIGLVWAALGFRLKGRR